MTSELAEKRDDEHGYREASAKELGLREWLFKRENRGFDKLVKRLQARNWVRKAFAENGRHAELMRANSRASHRRRAEDGREAAYRLRVYLSRVEVQTCRGCGAAWCKVPGVSGRRRQFCGSQCRERYAYRTNEAFRAKKNTGAAAWHAKARAS